MFAKTLEDKYVPTGGYWAGNFEGNKVWVLFKAFPIDPVLPSNEKFQKNKKGWAKEEEYWKTYKGRYKYKISVWGNDDTYVVKWFESYEEAKTIYDALDWVPNPHTMINDWEFIWD